MLSDNIRKYRKSKQMSQDELAEKLDVTRQSISLWETGQTQPSLDNIVALAKLFDISTDTLLMDNEPEAACAESSAVQSSRSARSKKPLFVITICLVVIAAIIITAMLLFKEKPMEPGNNAANEASVTAVDDPDDTSKEAPLNKDDNKAQSPVDEKQEENEPVKEDVVETVTPPTDENEIAAQPTIPEKLPVSELVVSEPVVPEPVVSEPVVSEPVVPEPVIPEPVIPEPVVPEPVVPEPVIPEPVVPEPVVPEPVTPPVQEVEPTKEADKDNMFEYFKDFVIQNGTINGDYCYISEPADTYGGYASEDFSLYYWGDTDTVEFCLHSVMDETFSINFYLYIPKEYTGKYKYTSSYYFRDTGEPLYEAKGYITAKDFTNNYPLSCDRYTGSSEVQNEFMEMSRQGICDLLDCLENFLVAEDLAYSFRDLGFTKF